MVLPFAIGAVVDGVPTTTHTPLSGQEEPVLAVVPRGAVMTGLAFSFAARRVRGPSVPVVHAYCIKMYRAYRKRYMITRSGDFVDLA